MILEEIAQHTKKRVQQNKKKKSFEEIKRQAEALVEKNPGFPFEEALRGDDIHAICEVKKASPSKGVIAEEFPYISIAKEYEAAGASAISVLTEPAYFLGEDRYLMEIKQAVQIPILRKDFVVDEYMIYEAKIIGADAILLICAILTQEELNRYLTLAHSLGLSALVEAHNEEEIRMALLAKARIIGVNNRDLKTFTVDLQNSIRLRALVPEDILFVSESGMKTPEDIKVLKQNRVNAVLIGETLMRSEDKNRTLASLLGRPMKMQPSVKFCGLRRKEDVAYANRLRPEFVGFVFAKSKRQVSPLMASQLKNKLDSDIKVVGVFVNEEKDTIATLLSDGVIDLAQLHGTETEEEIIWIKEQTNKPVIKAVKVRTLEDILRWKDSKADFLLLDQGEGGGTPFDWNILKQLPVDFKKPCFLAGGLTPETVEAAMKRIAPWMPYALDVSSGIEQNGYKDKEKMEAFMNAIRRLSL